MREKRLEREIEGVSDKRKDTTARQESSYFALLGSHVARSCSTHKTQMCVHVVGKT
jgi:hypothetical protein